MNIARTPLLIGLPAAALALGLLAGCVHVGPRTVEVDRFDYSTTIAESWKQQILLNIVKLRYMDMPVFVDVSSIVAGYSLETGVTMGGSWPQTTQFGGDTGTLGGSAKFTDRPTITFVPMTGDNFLRGFIKPIDPRNIFSMIQSGYAADFVLGMTVDSLNGVRNRSIIGGSIREADPDFFRAIELIREVQAAGAFGFTIEHDEVKGTTAIILLRHEGISPEIQAKAAEVRKLLGIPGNQQRLNLVFSPIPGTENELTVISRSMLQILGVFSTYMDVPEEDLRANRAIAHVQSSPPREGRNAVWIHSGKDKPEDAFTAVRYRGNWFWIENGDWQTKRALTTLAFLFTLAESGAAGNLPMITIPAQ